MEITRHNYEEYFILYIDNELNAIERKAVEAFVQENPDLEEELIMLQQSVLRPEENLIFIPKRNLLKDTASQGPVNESNYEEYFVEYGDDELSNEQKDLVEQFVYKFPQYQAEFELIQQARLFPETIAFPDKQELYRTEEDDHKVVPFAWWRLAAAAVVLLVIGALGLYITTLDGTGTGSKTVAKTATKNTTATEKQTTPAINNKEEQAVPVVDQQAPVTEEVAVNKIVEKKSSTSSNIPETPYVQQVKRAEMKTTEPVHTVVEANTALTAKPVDVDVIAYRPPVVDVNVNKPSDINKQAVAIVYADAAIPEEASDSKTYVLTTTVNKTPLRGFFRKVTRVVDKATNFEPNENSKGGVRIANFEVALK